MFSNLFLDRRVQPPQLVQRLRRGDNVPRLLDPERTVPGARPGGGAGGHTSLVYVREGGVGGHMNYKPGGGVGGHTSLVHVRGGAIIPPSWGKRKPALRNTPGGYQKDALHGPEED